MTTMLLLKKNTQDNKILDIKRNITLIQSNNYLTFTHLSCNNGCHIVVSFPGPDTTLTRVNPATPENNTP